MYSIVLDFMCALVYEHMRCFLHPKMSAVPGPRVLRAHRCVCADDQSSSDHRWIDRILSHRVNSGMEMHHLCAKIRSAVCIGTQVPSVDQAFDSG